jgi:hypothetical protein
MTCDRTREVYLGDCLYASFDGCQVRLRAPRDGVDHVVFLEPEVLAEFLRYVERLKTAKSPPEPAAS